MDFIARIGRALAYIEDHLKEDIDLEELARQANSSLYWFHRIFTRVVGDSAREYIRKRRLSEASLQLVRTDRTILEIALDYGYGSHEAFSRAFRDWIRMTPSTVRKARLEIVCRAPITEAFLRHEKHLLRRRPMETRTVNACGIRIVDLPACRMASSGGKPLDDFNAWWMKLDGQRVDRFYPRDFMYFDAEKGELVWLYALTGQVSGPCEYPLIDFPGGLYAVSISVDKNDLDGERVYKEIKEWIRSTGYFTDDESRDRPSLYHVVTSDRAFAKLSYRQLDIYVPVR